MSPTPVAASPPPGMQVHEEAPSQEAGGDESPQRRSIAIPGVVTPRAQGSRPQSRESDDRVRILEKSERKKARPPSVDEEDTSEDEGSRAAPGSKAEGKQHPRQAAAQAEPPAKMQMALVVGSGTIGQVN